MPTTRAAFGGSWGRLQRQGDEHRNALSESHEAAVRLLVDQWTGLILVSFAGESAKVETSRQRTFEHFNSL
jgi:hypothetical protein